MKIIPVPEALYLDVLNYLESCCETERHNPDDPCHELLQKLDAAGDTELVDVTLDDEDQPPLHHYEARLKIMNPQLPLTKILSLSNKVVCNGYEIDNWWPNESEGTVRLMCGDDDIVTLPLDQKLEMAPEGAIAPVEHDGDLYFFEFSVLYTLKPSLLPKE